MGNDNDTAISVSYSDKYVMLFFNYVIFQGALKANLLTPPGYVPPSLQGNSSETQYISKYVLLYVCRVRHNEPPDPPVHSGRAWNCWIYVILVHFRPDRSHLSGHMEGSLSRPCTLDTGVPQGSVLGPLFLHHTASPVTGTQMTPNCSFLSPPRTPKSQHTFVNAWLTANRQLPIT